MYFFFYFLLSFKYCVRAYAPLMMCTRRPVLFIYTAHGLCRRRRRRQSVCSTVQYNIMIIAIIIIIMIYIYVCAHYNKGETRSGRPPSHPRFPRVRSHKHTHMRAYINIYIYINIHLYTCTRAHTYMYIKVSMPWCPEQGRERTRALALEYYQR